MLILALAGLAHAAALSVTGNNVTDTLACVGKQDVNISGNGHTLTFTGDCGVVLVTGNNSSVGIDGTTRITLMGTGNTVTYKRNLSGAKKLPKTIGVGNTITKVP